MRENKLKLHTGTFTAMQFLSVQAPPHAQEFEAGAESDLQLLSRSVSAAPEQDAESGIVVPPVPETLEETGLAASTLQQLILKMLYSRGDVLGRELSEAMGLKFSLIEGIIEFLKQQHFLQAKKSLGMGNSTVLFALTRNGPERWRESAWRAISTPVPRRCRCINIP